VRFLSTRGGVAPATLSEAVLRGLADDGGLYVPERVPQVEVETAADDLAGAAVATLAPYFEGDALAPALSDIVREAFDISCVLSPLPDADGPSALLELFHGPSAAFKDFGARFLASCMARLARPGDPVRTILVATSGDTGGAVAAAFHGRPGFRVVVLYPDGLISARQEHQLTAWGGNVHAFALAGRFDDCQAHVKRALGDAALVRAHALGSANSISLGRLLPQVAYYVWAARGFRAGHGASPGFLVPTGNLGNALACVLARAMGAPIGPIVLCLNANRVLLQFLEQGEYLPQPSIATIANAMDVGAPSNLERLSTLFPDSAALRRGLEARSYDDDAIRAAIVAAHARYGVVACPHTATALAELMRRRDAGDARPWIAVATAHPAKFDTVVEPLLGQAIDVPAALRTTLERPSQRHVLEADYGAFVRALRELDPLP